MELNITLAGANFRPAAVKAFIKESLSRDTKIILEREPSNAWDSNAIKIVCKDDMDEDVFIGYVPKSDNAVLAQSLDADKPYSIVHTGFLGTIQPTFKIEFELLSIEERNEMQDNDALVRAAERIQRESDLDDEIPF